MQWDGTVAGLPAGGYDGALVASVNGHEASLPRDTLCIMAAAVRRDRQGGGLAGQALTALRDRATATGLARVIAGAAIAENQIPADIDGLIRPVGPW